MSDRIERKTWMKWLILGAIVYFLLPYDLLPDLLGLFGRIDDLLVLGWVGWTYRAQLRDFLTGRSRSSDTHRTAGSGGGPRPDTAASASERFDAYEVLGIERTASSDAIQAAYRSRMMEYHPDKVAHLGEELQKLAHEKAQQIERAYREIGG